MSNGIRGFYLEGTKFVNIFLNVCSFVFNFINFLPYLLPSFVITPMKLMLINISFENFWENHNKINSPHTTIINIAKDTGLPKETARRKRGLPPSRSK